MSMTLADILAPMLPERFFAEYYDQQPLHLPGAAEKFAHVLDWAGINRLLGIRLKNHRVSSFISVDTITAAGFHVCERQCRYFLTEMRGPG